MLVEVLRLSIAYFKASTKYCPTGLILCLNNNKLSTNIAQTLSHKLKYLKTLTLVDKCENRRLLIKTMIAVHFRLFASYF